MAKLNQAMTDLLRYNAAIVPRQRSMFSKNHSHTTTLDSAYLVPIMWDRVLPGDEKKIRYSGLARMATPIHPTMDEAFLDTWCFFIPDRLWWSHAKEFYGENKDASFNPDGVYVMPYLTPSQYYVKNAGDFDRIGSLNDYFGFPMGNVNVARRFDDVPEMYVTAGLHRSYQLIWNEYYRNSSVQPALQLNDGDTVTDAEWQVLRQIRKVCKLPDMYTTLLREPQAGADVLLPLGEWAPVVTRNTQAFDTAYGMERMLFGDVTFDGEGFRNPYPLAVQTEGNLTALIDKDASDSAKVDVAPINLWANLTSATAATINNLRSAITVQQLLEIDAIGGKRYQQILHAHFGVLTPDATLQRPELLGATRTNIGMRQVLQTGASMDVTIDGKDIKSPQGNAAAVSVTNVANEWICNKAFTEPGFIMVLAAVRPIHSYSQGIDPLLQKLQRYDHYWPVFDNLGNQPVYTRELFAQMGNTTMFTEADVDRVFGYKEAWQEYRMRPNRVSGLMRPEADKTLASWNYATNFKSVPYLNDAFVSEDPTLIDRTIAVQSEPQFILDSYFEYTDIKNMSVHSVPGLTRL